MTITLPWPPSINHYWRRRGSCYFISKEGQSYRANVQAAVWSLGKPKPSKERLKVWIEATVPDRRKRDLDNICKAILDSLQHAGVYESDSQIDDLRVIRGEICEHKEGSIVVMIEPMALSKSA